MHIAKKKPRGSRLLPNTLLMERVVRPPAFDLEYLKEYARQRYPEGVMRREGTLDCLEIFGQSGALPRGYARHNLRCESFDVRILVGADCLVLVDNLLGRTLQNITRQVT